jgi:hypothetical protein
LAHGQELCGSAAREVRNPGWLPQKAQLGSFRGCTLISPAVDGKMKLVLEELRRSEASGEEHGVDGV